MSLTKQKVATNTGNQELLVSNDSRLVPGINKAMASVAKPAMGPGMAKAMKLAMIAGIRAEYQHAKKFTVDEFISAVEKQAKAIDAQRRSTSGSALTALINGCVSNWLDSFPIPPKQPTLHGAASIAFMAFEDWAKAHRVIPYRWDEPVFASDYGGSANLVMMGRSIKSTVLHITTAPNIYDEDMMQAAALFNATKQSKIEVRNAIVLRLPTTAENVDIEARELISDKEHEHWLGLFYAHLGIWQRASGYRACISVEKNAERIISEGVKAAANG